MQFKRYQRWMGGFLLSCLSYFLTTTGTPIEASQGLGGPTHIGTFEGSTTFATSSSNGINPGLFLEVMDDEGNLTQYESEEGVITIPETKEGAYVTQAKLLGKTMYRDQDTGELLDTWEEGRNLQLESVKMPVLTTSNEDGTKTNILTVNEEVTLRGISEVRDTLNCLSGEVVQRICEIVLDGSDLYSYSIYKESTTSATYRISMEDKYKANTKYLCDKLPSKSSTSVIESNSIYLRERESDNIYIELLSDTIGGISIELLKGYLQSNPVTVQYQPLTESIKTVVLTNTYNFQPVMNREVRVEGTALPLICSVTVPTETLSFVINPNEKDVDQQFIAPEFEIVNEAPASIQVTLKEFEQVGSVFHDVLPETHTDWSVLTKEQSKDLALALNPMPSTNWVSLTEAPRYVANSQNVLIGEVKPKSSVRFTFSAKHGLAFTEQLNSNYRLSFIFDF